MVLKNSFFYEMKLYYEVIPEHYPNKISVQFELVQKGILGVKWINVCSRSLVCPLK